MGKEMPFTITQYSNKDGLPQNQVSQMIQRGDGALLLATTNGLVEFNGYAFKPLKLSEEARKINFYKLFWSEKHQQLCGSTIEGEYYSILPTFGLINPSARYNEKIKDTYIQNDSVYLISNTGRVFKGMLPDHKMIEDGHSSVQNPICILKRGSAYYIGSLNGLFKMDTKRGQTVRIHEGLFNRLASSPYNGQPYAVSLTRLYRFEGDSLKLLLHIDPKNEEEHNRNITFGKPGEVLLASRKGFYLVKEDSVWLFNSENGLPSNHLASVCYNSSENCIFIGTDEKGLLRLNRKNFELFGAARGFDVSSLNSVILSKNGKIYSSESCCNIYEFNGSSASILGKLKASFASIAEINDTLCAGTWGAGIFLVHDAQKAGVIAKPSLPGNNVHAVFKDTEGRIWAGTDNGVAMGPYLAGIKPVLTGDVRGKILNFYELKNKSICAGGENGVYIFEGTKLKYALTEKAGLRCKEVRAFYEDEKNRLWIGTYGGGLYCFENEKLVSLNQMPGCKLSPEIFCFAPDSLGYFNITSNFGLQRVKMQTVFNFYEGRIKYLIPFRYTEENGMMNTEFNGGFQYNYLKMPGGVIYFPTIDGLVKYTPAVIAERKLKPKITEFYVNDTLHPVEIYLLERNSNSLRFNFSCVNYSELYNVHYQHRLEGEKSYGWTLPDKTNSVVLPLLPPGKYVFSVRAIDGFNDPAPTVVTFAFEIKPHYYEALWFRLILVTALLMLTIITIRWRIKQVRRRTEESQHYERKLAEIELKAIQAQLNPHFIFNCLNTIKYFILEKDYASANQSLSIFSSLMRNSLENSDKLFVPLSKELKFVRDYIELEKFRLHERLEYSIVCNPSVSGDASVPYLIIQPHVENAIKHGIANLEDKKGKLSVYIEKTLTGLVCTITDNGIGRDASRKLNAKNVLHASKGTLLMQEKSLFLKQYNNYNCSIIITDLFDEHNKPAGTRVNIEIPFQ